MDVEAFAAPATNTVAIDREKALLSAQKFIDKKRYDRALEEYQRILREESNDTRTLLKLGDLQIRMQAFADAMSTYDRVAQLYEAQGFAVKAVAVYKQIRDHIQKRSPDLADKFAHVVPRLAQIYAKLQLTSDAIQAYDEVATRYLRLGRKQEAIEIYQQMVALDPNNPLTHVRLAEALCHLEEIDLGLDAFYAAAELLFKLGRDEDVMRVVERGLHFRQDPKLARIGAEVHLKRGTRADGLQALTKLQICFKADPKDLVVFGLLAQAFTLLEQTDKAIEVYKEMALLAREKGEVQLFAQLVDHLMQLAPDDDQIRALNVVAHGQPAPSSRHMVAAAPVSPPLSEIPETLDESEIIEELDDEIEFVDDGVPAAEPQAEAVTDLGAIAQKALSDADSFRRLRLFDKAVDALRKGLTFDPNSLEIRYKLREILYEAGDPSAMLAESLNIATLLINYGYVQEAVPFVEEVLASSPDHPDAIRLYTQLYGVPPTRTVRPEPASESRRPGRGEALPSYDIEGVHASRAFGSGPAQRLADVDDPFGQEAPTYSLDNELPSFDLDEALISELDTSSAFGHGDLEHILDEADLYVQRGRRNEARALLEAQLRKHPNHPLILEKLDELTQVGNDLDALLAGDRSHVSAAGTSDELDELASSFQALDHLEMRGSISKLPPSAQVADVDAVFAQFKAGVRSQVEEADSATHYDLGVAYKEMGLTSDALKEFDLAAKDPVRACMCHAMVGLIYLEQNELDLAIAAYARGLGSAQKTTEQELSLYYDLGIAHEMKSDYITAVRYFREIARTDPGYRDVVERINALEHPDGAQVAPKAKAAGSEDDFDRAFDDLFGG